MEKSPDSESLGHPTASVNNIGQQLRLAREAKRWAIADVAQSLNLSEQQVTELENEHYHSFPALVYVRGYLRSYARLVGLTEKEILNTLEHREFESNKKPKTIESHLEYEHYRPAFNHRRWLPWLNVLIIVVLIGLVLLWLSEKNNGKKIAPINTETTTLSSNSNDSTTLDKIDTSGKSMNQSNE